MSDQRDVFGRVVGSLMRPQPLVCGFAEPCLGALNLLAAANARAVIVLDDQGRAAGILTEHDVAGRVAFKVAPDTPIARVMTAPVFTVGEGEPLYRALALMRRHGLGHLPVVDSQERPVGMLDRGDAMAAAAGRTLAHVDRLAGDDDPAGLAAIKAAQAELAGDLIEGGMTAVEAQGLLADINGDIVRRVVDRQIGQMEADGWGETPRAFDVIVMGSAGRGESFLAPDQDNGFILDDYPDRLHPQIDRYFAELAGRMVADLDAIGFPLCPGFVMATNPTWRKQAREWHEQIERWVARRHPAAFLNADIFFDFRPVRGDGTLARRLKGKAAAAVKGRDAFLKGLATSEGHHAVGLTWRNRLVTEGRDHRHRGEINAKRDGILPLVESVRLMALREGIEETGTLARIDALAVAGVLGRDEQDYLKGAFAHITALVLGQQIVDCRAGRPPGNFIRPASLTAREKDMLVDGLKAAQELARRARADLTGEIL